MNRIFGSSQALKAATRAPLALMAACAMAGCSAEKLSFNASESSLVVTQSAASSSGAVGTSPTLSSGGSSAVSGSSNASTNPDGSACQLPPYNFDIPLPACTSGPSHPSPTPQPSPAPIDVTPAPAPSSPGPTPAAPVDPSSPVPPSVPMTPAAPPIPADPPIPSAPSTPVAPTCTPDVLYQAERMTFQRIDRNANDIAAFCVDGAFTDPQSNLPHDNYSFTRFMNTCGDRFCRSVGYESGRVIELSPSLTATLECRLSTPPAGIGNACSDSWTRPPLVSAPVRFELDRRQRVLGPQHAESRR